MHWTNITATTNRSNLPALEEWFWHYGAVSVTVEDNQDIPIYEPAPGETPVWDEVLVTALFEQDVDIDPLLVNLAADGFMASGVSRLEDKPWEREWLVRFKPMLYGRRLWVCPTGFEIDAEPKVVIHLDPGLAFGTGTHETTRLCLEYLDSLEPGTLEDALVIDFGCGSGILAVAAALLGAKRVVGIDNDQQALTATLNNAQRNSVVIETGLPEKIELPQAKVVLANILAQPLVHLADKLINATEKTGELVLSGIMESQADWVMSAYQDKMTLIDKTILGGWVRLVLRR